MDPIITGSAWVLLVSLVEAIGLTLLRANPNYIILINVTFKLRIFFGLTVASKYHASTFNN